jgi:hypothetical protein
MKKILLSLLLGAMTIGIGGSSAQAFWGRHHCADSNSKACRDAREAFAKHHNGVYPGQYYNEWYAGRQGRWHQRDRDWRWEGMDGDDYYRTRDHGWRWFHHHHDDDD